MKGQTAEFDFKKRTKRFALEIIKLVNSLPKNSSNYVIGNQILRSATSTGANYRSASRARSNADFISKITICEEEADECCYWLELLFETNQIKEETFQKLFTEANELTAIFVTSCKTAKIKNSELKKNLQ